MPIPLAMMIPFMATQSLVMGEAFGKAFQFGKRKMSAMSNEEFNKLTIEQVASEMFQSYKNIQPELSESMKRSNDLQSEILIYMIDMPRDLLARLFGISQETLDADSTFDPRGKTAADVFKETPTTTSHDDFKPPPKPAPKPSSIHSSFQPTPPPVRTQTVPSVWSGLTLKRLLLIRASLTQNLQKGTTSKIREDAKKHLKSISIEIAKRQSRSF